MITLYSKDSKGKIRLWNIKAEGDSYYQQSGQEGGKLTDWVGVKCKPKNIGKSNGTTAEQQALSEMQNKISIKLKEGYYRTREDAVNDTTFTPMLAEKYEDYKDKIKFPQIAQPKLDGARCNIYIKNGEIVCRTRSNRDYVSVPHLIEKFKPVLEKHPTWVIDGELYNHAMKDNFEDLMSIIRQSKPTQEDLKKSSELIDLYVYDIHDTSSPNERNIERIQNLAYLRDNFNDITVLTHDIILSKDKVESTLNYFLEKGYEGMMLRNPDGLYKPNGRSKDLLKCKIFSDEEFEIVDVLEGNGAWSGCAKKITIRLNDTDTCEASLKGTQEQLAKVLQNKQQYISKMVTVTYFGRTNTNSLRFPVCKDIEGRHDL
jgi:DNA ligase-1